MKHIYNYLVLGVTALLLNACNNESESDLLEPKVYFENKEYTYSIKGEDETMSINLAARVSTITSSPVDVTYSIADQSVVDAYNAKYGTEYIMFDPANVSLSNTTSTIPSGEVYADNISLELSNLGTMEEGKLFILPIQVHSTSLPTVPETDITYYFISKPVTKLKVGVFNYDHISVPFPTGTYFNSFTYEALVYLDRFGTNNTIMGTEGVVILRIGDASGGVTPEDIIEVAGQQGYKVTEPVVTQKWYHIALTYDQPSGKTAIYVNGSKWAESAWSIPGFDPNSDVGFNIGMIPGFQWGERPLYGCMAEIRVWSVARTETQLKQNMLSVDPKSKGLELYYKLDGSEEQTGGKIKDSTGKIESSASSIEIKTLDSPVVVE